MLYSNTNVSTYLWVARTSGKEKLVPWSHVLTSKRDLNNLATIFRLLTVRRSDLVV